MKLFTKRKFLCILIVILILLLPACSSKKSASSAGKGTMNSAASYNGAPKSEVSEKTAKDMAVASTGENKTNTTGDTSVKQSEQDSSVRKVIYNASVKFDVKDLKGSYDSILSKASEMGGYVAGSNISDNVSSITVRMPTKLMNSFLKYLDTFEGKNKVSSINTDDVTDQYTDSQSSLRNLKAQEEQLLLIMKKANTVDETLKVEDQLYKVRGQIETIQGRINMWDKLLEYSTISITINKIPEITGGKEVGISFITFKEIKKAITNGFNSTLNFAVRAICDIFIFLVSIIPLLPFIALAVWLVIRYRIKRKKIISK